MTCQMYQEMIPDYLAEEMPPEALKQFLRHQKTCESCRAELASAKAVWLELGELPAENPGPGLRSRFYAMLESEKQAISSGRRKSRYERCENWINGWWPARPAMQLALATAVMLIGLIVGATAGPGRGENGEIDALHTELETMHEMIVVSLLDRESSSERLTGVNWIANVSHPSPELINTLAGTLYNDPSLNVRLAAANALGRYRLGPGVVDQLSQSLSQEDSPLVQIALIDLLIAVQETKALEALREFIKAESAQPEVRAHARSLIGSKEVRI